MTNVKKHVFFDENSSGTTSPACVVQGIGDVFLVSVRDAGSFKFEGSIDAESVEEKWEDIGAIALSDYSVKDYIESDGMYMVMVSGMEKVRAVAESGVGSMVVTATLCR